MATTSVNLSVNTNAAHQDLEEFAHSINAMLQQKGAAAGKTVRLYDSKADLAELKAMQKAMQEVIRLHGSIRGPMNSVGQNTASNFSQVNTAAMFPNDPAKQVKFLADLMARTMTHHFSHGQFANRTGLDYQEVTNRQPGATPVNPPPPPAPPRQPDTRFGSSVHHLANQAVAGGAGGALGQAAGTAMQGAAGGLGGLGVVGGGLLGLAGYGVFKAASAVNDGLDKSKAEAIEIDKFKRQLGDLGVNFDGLRDHVREAASGMGLSFEQAGKMAQILTRDSSSKIKGEKAIGDETKNAAALARATGMDGEVTARFFAEMRASRSTDDVQGSRKMALSIADAIKRSGDPMNADKMLQHMVSFTERTRDMTLGRMDAGAYGGLLSGLMSGAGGIKAGTAAGMINSFDQSSRAGGNSEAADAFFFQALNGNGIGAGKALALRQGGLFTSTKSMFSDESSPLYDKNFKGGSNGTNLTKYMQHLDQVYGKNESENKTMALAELGFGGNWAHAAQWQKTYKQYGAGGLDKTAGMLEQMGLKPDQINASGVMQIAGIANAGSDIGKLQEQRGLMADRKDLTPADKAALENLRGSTNPKMLAGTMVGIARTLDSEETDGKKLNDLTTSMQNDLQKLSTGLIPASMWTNNLLAGILERLNPDSEVAKKFKAEKEAMTLNAVSPSNLATGRVPDSVQKEGIGLIRQKSFQYADEIRKAEEKYGLERGELAGLIQTESNFNPSVFGKQKDKNGKVFSSSAFGMTQMTTAAVKDSREEFKRQNGYYPEMKDVQSQTDGKTYSVPVNPWDQIQLGAIFKRSRNVLGKGMSGGNRIWKAGPGGADGSGPDSVAMLDKFSADVYGNQKRYNEIYDAGLDGKSPLKTPAGNHSDAGGGGNASTVSGAASVTVTVALPGGQQLGEVTAAVPLAGKPRASGVSSAYRGPR